MDRRRPATVIGALCVVVMVLGGPVPAVAQAKLAPGPRIEVTDLPALSELPPLPASGEPVGSVEEPEFSRDAMSGVQIFALVLAGGVLVAGGFGLALVTRRGRGEHAAGRGERPDPSTYTPAR